MFAFDGPWETKFGQERTGESMMHCRRCGTCCEKGGPSLHREDASLVESGRIPARHLFTIRRGERVRDNVQGILLPLPREIIKIKGRPGSWTCHYYDRAGRGCMIYDHRPLECRMLNCRDTRRIEAVYATQRLTRRDLLSDVEGLWALVVDHERRCDFSALRALVDEQGREDTVEQESSILEALRYDTHLRQLAVEKGGLDVRMLDFVFGRPLADTLDSLGIRLIRKDAGFGLVRR